MSTVNPVVLENQLPGTPQDVWDLSGPGSTNIEGFATDISIDHGDTVQFKVGTDSLDYRIEIYRLGYYGGDGARLVTTIQHQSPSPLLQPDPLFDAATGLVDAGNWQVTDSWHIPQDAVSGVYIAKLVRQDGTFGENHIPFIVRDDDGQSDVLFQTSDATWQAYNPWGGRALYTGLSGSVAAYAVSYNRPILTRDIGLGENFVFGSEYPAIRWLEANGYDVSYTTNVDTARSGSELLDHRVFLSVGHDEYWSGEQRANVEAARDAGVNLAFWSGNEVYWKTQWEPSIDPTHTSYRTLVTYKETQTDVSNPSGVWTGTWADPNATDGASPQNALTGTIFTVNGHFGAIQIPYEFASLRFWRNASIAGIEPGESASLVLNILGPEWNEDLDNGFRPAGLIDLSSTTYLVGARLQDLNFSEPVFVPGTATHSLTLYRAPSGALVFSAGTQFWTWGLDADHDPGRYGDTAHADPNVQQAMVNLFADMGVQPETLQSHLVVASPSTDFVAPTASFSELEVLVSGSSATVSLEGSAVDLGGLVAGIELSIDGGARWHPASGTTSWNYSSNGSVPTKVFARAIDDSANLGVSGSVPATVLARAISDSTNTSGTARAISYVHQLDNQAAVVWNNYDAAGLWNLQSITHIDGTLALAYFDQLNNQAAVVWNNYDAVGFWRSQNINYDDGTHSAAQLDLENKQPWSLVWNNYDNVGHWDTQSVDYDDNTRAVAQLDPLNNQPWSLVWNNFDTAGHWDTQSIDYDDGARAWSDIDQSNTADWYSDNYYYDTNNQLISHYQVLDNGNVVHLSTPST